MLSWREVAKRFHSTWDTVFRCVEHAVVWGLAHRNLDGVVSIGVDEFAWKKRHKYLTLVYQIDHRCKRLPHVARDRTVGSFNGFFDMLGQERSKAIVFVASDMWQAFRNVVRHRCSTAVHVLDRFHVTKLLHEAVDKVRRGEVRSLRAAGRPAMLTKTRWLLLNRRENMSTDDRGRLRELLRINLRSVRACLLKEQFQRFWNYSSGLWAEKFLARWTTMAMRSRGIDQRHEHLAAPTFPLGYGSPHRRDADRQSLGEQHAVQPAGRQPLLAARPLRRLHQECLQPGPGLLPDRPTPRLPLHPRRRRLRQVPLHRVARDPHLARHPTGRTALHQHLVPNHMNLIHPEHPPRGRTRDVDAGWISFRAAFGSLSERRHQ